MNEVDKSVFCHWEIYTSVPKWFFDNSGIKDYSYTELVTDIGLAQLDPFNIDLVETETKLREFMTNFESIAIKIAKVIEQKCVRLIFADISSLGVYAGKVAGVKTILIENFVWDFIYEPYGNNFELHQMGCKLRDYALMIDLHFSTEPYCVVYPGSCEVSPVARQARKDKLDIRSSLKISKEQYLVLISMGGIESSIQFEELIRLNPRLTFLYPGSFGSLSAPNLIRLPHHHNYFHPDLVNASDVIIAKLGYSSLAEAYIHGVNGCFIANHRNPESAVLAKFVIDEQMGVVLSDAELSTFDWTKCLENTLSLPRRKIKKRTVLSKYLR